MKIDNILLFEPKDINNFYPFSILHPIWELRIGKFKIFERYQFLFPDSSIHYFGRKPHILAFLKKYNVSNHKIAQGNVLAIDSSVLPTTELFENIKKFNNELNSSFLIKYSGKLIGIYLTSQDFEKAEEFQRPELLSSPEIDLFKKFPIVKFEKLIKLNYLYDLLDAVETVLYQDFVVHEKEFDEKKFSGVYFRNPKQIYIADSAEIMPGCVFDATKGPIILDENSTIMPQSTIIGPAYVGKNSTIKIGAKIYQNTVIGDLCKIGGEVENSIIQDFSNKQHEGFLGHSFLGEWINIGADTNTSDLKNTYSNIKIRIERNEIDTGRIFLGVLMGDHTKTGINTMLTTGTVTGICGILVREWFLPNFIPSFSWGGGKDSPIYKVEKALQTARVVMKRRNRELLAEEEELIRLEYDRIVSLEHR